MRFQLTKSQKLVTLTWKIGIYNVCAHHLIRFHVIHGNYDQIHAKIQTLNYVYSHLELSRILLEKTFELITVIFFRVWCDGGY